MVIVGILYSCGGSNSPKPAAVPDKTTPADNTASAEKSTDDKGVGKFTHVDLTARLDPKMASSGKEIYDLKCSSCHKLSEEKLVGPGWKDVTTRRKPEWILNFVTNTDEMLNKDAKAQALLEICMVRMPNQNLSDQDARNILEFMRQNDGVK